MYTDSFKSSAENRLVCQTYFSFEQLRLQIIRTYAE